MTIIHTSPLPRVEIPDVSITELVMRHAQSIPDRVAITDGASSAYTFAELDSAIRSMAGGLSARGFGIGDVLGIMAPNVPEYAVVFHAVGVVGATITTINPTYGANEVRFQLQDSGASLLLTIPMFLDVALAAIEGTSVSEVIVVGEAPGAASMASLMGDPRSTKLRLMFTSM